MKLAVPHHAGVTLHPHVAFDAPNKPADFKLTSLNQPVNHSACAASAKATAHPLISSSFSFPLPSQSGVSDILCPPFPLSPSSLIPSYLFPSPLPHIPPSFPLHPSFLPIQRHLTPKTSPYTPSRPCAQSFITARPNQLSHTPSFKKRHPTCRALPSSHVSSPPLFTSHQYCLVSFLTQELRHRHAGGYTEGFLRASERKRLVLLNVWIKSTTTTQA